MDAFFWHNKWKNNEIGFHESEVNPLLENNIWRLDVKQGSRIFLPLCGKTLDISWLLSKGYRIVGAELSELAIAQLFGQLDITPEIIQVGNLKRYKATNIDIFVGDIFELTRELLGPVDAIYDRASLVALPVSIRKNYTTHLVEVTGTAQQLVICYEYDQKLVEGPPFSIAHGEVKQHYDQYYKLEFIERVRVKGGLRGVDASESVFLLGL